MSNWPLQSGAGAPFAMSTQNADIRTVRLTAGSPAHTVGAWTTLVASAPRGVVALAVHVLSEQGSGAITDHLIDVAIGDAGAEQIIIPAIPMRAASFRFTASTSCFPVTVPPGARISARMQSSVASFNEVTMVATPVLGNALSSVAGGSLIALGESRAASRGGAVVSGAYNAGAYVEVVAATPVKLRGLYLCVAGNGSAGAYQSQTAYDVAVGPAGSEVPVINRIGAAHWDQMASPMLFGPFFVATPAGARLAVRSWSGAGSNYVHLLGVV